MSRSKRRARRGADWGVAALLAALALVLAAGSAHAAQPFENLMPEGCIVYVGLRNVPGLSGSVRGADHVRALCEAMRPALDRTAMQVLETDIDSMLEYAGDLLGAKPKDLLGMLGGQAAVGVLPRGDRDGCWLLLADVSGNPDLAATVVRNALTHHRELGTYDIVEEEFRGKTVYRIQPVEKKPAEGDEATGKAANADKPDGAAQAEGEDAAEEELPWEETRRIENPGFIVLSDNILAVASSPDRALMEQHLVLRAGEALPNVGTSERYLHVQPFLGQAPDVLLFVDIRRIEEVKAAETASAVDPSAPSAVGLGFSLGPEGAGMQGLLLAPRPRGGVVRAFSPQAGVVKPPAWADADSVAYAGVRFSASVFWEEIKAQTERELPEQRMAMDQWLKGQSVDIENGLINALGDRWFFYVPALSGSDDETGGVSSVALIADLRDSAAFGAAWKQVLAIIPPMIRVETVNFAGADIQQFSPAVALPEGVQTPMPCVAVLPDKLVLASGLDAVKSIIKNDTRGASPLLAQKRYQQLVRRTMEDPDVLAHVDWQGLGKVLKARAERRQRMVAKFAGANEEEAKVGAEPKPEPQPEETPWDSLGKSASSGVLAAKWIDEGLQVEAWSAAATDAE